MNEAKKRLFIAINFPKDIKDKIATEIEKIRYDFNIDIRFLGPDNWHITLAFLGHQTDEMINNILEATTAAAKDFSVPKIELSDMSYGPLGKTPRMVWLNCTSETSAALAELKKSLVNALLDRGVNFKQEYRLFKAHVTAARFQTTEKEKLPVIDKKLGWNFTANSLDLMESHLKRSGAEYIRLAGIEFRNHD